MNPTRFPSSIILPILETHLMSTFSIDADILPPITDIILPSTLLANTNQSLSISCDNGYEAILAKRYFIAKS